MKSLLLQPLKYLLKFDFNAKNSSSWELQLSQIDQGSAEIQEVFPVSCSTSLGQLFIPEFCLKHGIFTCSSPTTALPTSPEHSDWAQLGRELWLKWDF